MILTRLLPIALVLSMIPSAVFGQYFGQNKVRYDKFEWSIIKTDHFEVYFYEGENEAALDAARMAERSYAKLSSMLNHEVEELIPLILYASHSDFQQTNITSGMISEGTGGITESFKRRVIIPFTGSYGELDHVLTHELVHAFQFDVLFGNRAGFLPNPFMTSIPLWFIEGMAEHLSIPGRDPNTEMWLRDAALEGYLPSIEDLGRVRDIRVYRMGQSVWDYIAKTYGQRKVGELLRGAGRTANLSRLFENILGVNTEILSQGWLEEIRKTYLPQIAEFEKPEHYGRRLTDHRKDLSVMNVAPSVSPRGDRVVYISDKSLYNDIYMASTLDGKVLDRLVQGERTGDFESLRFFNTSIAWSPDESFIAFPAKVGSEDAIYIFNVDKKKRVRRLTFGFDGVYSPTWSPDGKRLAFIAVVNGQSDIFVVDADGEHLDRLTQDRYAERDPSWSPDGYKIAFSTDRGADTDFDTLVFGPMVIAIYDLVSGEIDILLDQEGMNITPQWSPDGTELAYVSDRTGITNIFMTNLEDGETYQITNVLSGVSGITASSPPMSWSCKGNRMVFCAFTGGGWDVYAINDPQRFKVPYEPAEEPEMQGPPIADYQMPASAVRRQGPLAEVTSFSYETHDPPSEEDVSVRLVELKEYLNPEHAGTVRFEEPRKLESEMQTVSVLPDTSAFSVSRYKLKFTQDLAAGGIGFASNVNVYGQTALVFSDILGNHTMVLAASVFGSLAESDLLFAYLNMKNRTSYGLAVFQERNDFFVYTAPDRGEYESQVYRGAEVFWWRPFNRFNRVELGLQGTSVASRVFPYGFLGDSIEGDKTRYYASSTLGLVHDNTLFGSTGPLAGGRSRISYEQAVGDIRFSSFLVDYRKYKNLRQRYAFAARFVWAGSYGRNPQLFRIGGPYTLRGPDYGVLEGTHVAFANFEFRFPFIEQLVLGWPAPLGFRAIRGVLFFDIGGAWFDDSQFQPVTSEGSGPFRLQDTIAGYGFGLRLNLGLFILRYDLVQMTDMSRSIGGARSFFTFGGDF